MKKNDIKQMTLRITKEQWYFLRKIAYEKETTMTNLLSNLINREMEAVNESD